MEEITALVNFNRVSIALSTSALFLDNGQTGQTGQIVVKLVMWGSRQENDHVAIQRADLFKAQGIVLVLEMKLRLGYAFKGLVLIQLVGTCGQAGPNVLLVVGLENSKELGIVVQVKGTLVLAHVCRLKAATTITVQ